MTMTVTTLEDNMTMQKDTMMDSSEDCCPTLSTYDQEMLDKLDMWLVGGVQVLIILVGLLSTSGSICVFSQKKFRKNILHKLLLCLAVFDLSHIIFTFFDCLFYGYGVGHYIYNLLTPYLLYPLKAISMTCSIFMMMSLALERYIAVSNPLSRVPSSHSCKFFLRYLIPVICCSFLLNLPKFFLVRISIINSSEVILSITELRTNHYYITYYSWTRLFLLGFVPLLWVSILNLKIYLAVLHSAQGSVLTGLRKNTSSTGGDNLSRASPNKKSEYIQFVILLSIIIIFILCSIPRIILLMHEVTIIDTLRCCISANRIGEGFPMWNLVLGRVSDILLMVNPTANFVVYSVINVKFRCLILTTIKEIFRIKATDV